MNLRSESGLTLIEGLIIFVAVVVLLALLGVISL